MGKMKRKIQDVRFESYVLNFATSYFILIHKQNQNSPNMKFVQIATALVVSLFLSQNALAQKNIELTGKTLTLQLKGTEGKNGNAVVYNPDKDLYYATIAGNADYPLETFSENGENLYQGETGIDVRGVWYNSKTKNLEANCYDAIGYYVIKTDSRGYAGTGTEEILPGRNQPSANACGNIDRKANQVLFYHSGSIVGYERETGQKSDMSIYLNLPTKIDNINTTAFIYTGKKKMEIGLLNFEHKEVYLFNIKSGEHTATVKLPIESITHNRFRFGYANGYIFLFDVEARKWTGYQIF